MMTEHVDVGLDLDLDIFRLLLSSTPSVHLSLQCKLFTNYFTIFYLLHFTSKLKNFFYTNYS